MLSYYEGEPHAEDGMWLAEMRAVAPWCVGRGLDPGTGSRTLRPNVVRGDVMLTHRPQVCARAEALPFADGAFDFVVNAHLIEHLIDPRAAIIEWLRVVRPGGAVAMVIPDTRFTGGMNTDPTPHVNEWGPADFQDEVLGWAIDGAVRWFDRRGLVEWAPAEVVYFGQACPSWSFCCVLRRR